MLSVALALLPVVSFLLALFFLDSFKLLTTRAVLLAVAAGGAAALLVQGLHGAVFDAWAVDPRLFSRYGAPLTEEAAKSLYVAWLLRRHRIGFLVDAAILGFAVGAGFALIENVDYLRNLAGAGPGLWVVRGFGTALLHGAATAILAMIAHAFAERGGAAGGDTDGGQDARSLVGLPAGLLAAVALHSLFNHFVLPPVIATAVLLLALPVAFVLAFEKSEASTRRWLSVGLDDELDLLESIRAGTVLDTRVGGYLRSLTARFPAESVADMLCLLQVNLELSIRAKGVLLAREAGFAPPVGQDVRDNLEELRYLERAIGRTGLLAVRPILRRSSRDLWQIYKLSEIGGSSRPGPISP
ncbi:MAG TPA: PrsW family glutamic-type intramembrane protease [Vicinamibacteria bacterium]|nr:PrsW family glutamic-type intramembrane protease [Vicinamibacteria bacterium]